MDRGAQPERIALGFGEPILSKDVDWDIVYQRMDRGTAAVFGIDGPADSSLTVLYLPDDSTWE